MDQQHEKTLLNSIFLFTHILMTGAKTSQCYSRNPSGFQKYLHNSGFNSLIISEAHGMQGLAPLTNWSNTHLIISLIILSDDPSLRPWQLVKNPPTISLHLSSGYFSLRTHPYSADPRNGIIRKSSSISFSRQNADHKVN